MDTNNSFHDKFSIKVLRDHKITYNVDTNKEYCIVGIVFSLTEIALKSLLIKLLRILERDGGTSSGTSLSLHLCYTELSLSILTIMTMVLVVLTPDIEGALDVCIYLNIAISSLFFPVLYFIKLFIMMQATLKVYLDARLEVVWDHKNTKMLLTTTWICSGILFTSVTIACIRNNDTRSDLLDDVYKFTIIPCLLGYIIGAVTSNTYLLVKLNRSRIGPPAANISFDQQQQQRPDSFWKVLIKCKYVVPVLMSLSFSLFLIIATLEIVLDVKFIGILDQTSNYAKVNLVTLIMFEVMVLVDSIVYVVFERKIRRKIDQQLNGMRWWITEMSNRCYRIMFPFRFEGQSPNEINESMHNLNYMDIEQENVYFNHQNYLERGEVDPNDESDVIDVADDNNTAPPGNIHSIGIEGKGEEFRKYIGKSEDVNGSEDGTNEIKGAGRSEDDANSMKDATAPTRKPMAVFISIPNRMITKITAPVSDMVINCRFK